ncbi:unnamed protein product [Periconia digitata]|uniref:Zn(2)-C6 fungal-type domain-containing protein n=1 Tax=Periconia digitata TaxID=1303443 RepID=A0A9W4U1Y2_9PLEO|nr:unnamed protein product [Periconia digitata]
MPGVPSSRGCKACRVQKKKCDQKHPACSRCSRLEIPCVERGQQRFKFVEQGPQAPNQVARRLAAGRKVTVVVPDLSNQTDHIRNSFIDAFRVSKLGYQFELVGGSLFPEIPKRLGSNDALDQSASALVGAYKYITTGEGEREAQEKYGMALRTLRVTLQNLKQGATADTLTTIWLLMLCQNWIARSHVRYGTHSEGMCTLLNAFAETIDWQSYDNYDAQLIIASTYMVLNEQLSNPRVAVGPWLRKLAGPYGPKNYIPSEIQMIKLRKMERANKLLLDPLPDRTGMEDIYRDARSDITIIKRNVTEVSAAITDETPLESLPLNHIYTLYIYRIRYCMVLPYAILLNYSLAALAQNDPEYQTLPEELAFYIDEVIDTARSMTPFRPLGTETVPPVLSVAWAASEDAVKQAQIEAWIAEYDKDFAGANTMPVAKWCRKWIKGQREKWLAFCAGRPLEDDQTDEVTDAELEATLGPGRKCCIL